MTIDLLQTRPSSPVILYAAPVFFSPGDVLLVCSAGEELHAERNVHHVSISSDGKKWVIGHDFVVGDMQGKAFSGC